MNLPNALTFFRILAGLTLLGLFMFEGQAVAYTMLGIFVLAAVTDHWDGEWARRTGQITRWGQIMDPIADKALVLSALAGLSFESRVAWPVTLIILARDLGATYLRWDRLRQGWVLSAQLLGKLKTVTQYLWIGLLLFIRARDAGHPILEGMAQFLTGVVVSLTLLSLYPLIYSKNRNSALRDSSQWQAHS